MKISYITYKNPILNEDFDNIDDDNTEIDDDSLLKDLEDVYTQDIYDLTDRIMPGLISFCIDTIGELFYSTKYGQSYKDLIATRNIMMEDTLPNITRKNFSIDIANSILFLDIPYPCAYDFYAHFNHELGMCLEIPMISPITYISKYPITSDLKAIFMPHIAEVYGNDKSDAFYRMFDRYVAEAENEIPTTGAFKIIDLFIIEKCVAKCINLILEMLHIEKYGKFDFKVRFSPDSPVVEHIYDTWGSYPGNPVYHQVCSDSDINESSIDLIKISIPIFALTPAALLGSKEFGRSLNYLLGSMNFQKVIDYANGTKNIIIEYLINNNINMVSLYAPNFKDMITAISAYDTDDKQTKILQAAPTYSGVVIYTMYKIQPEGAVRDVYETLADHFYRPYLKIVEDKNKNIYNGNNAVKTYAYELTKNDPVRASDIGIAHILLNVNNGK